MSKEKGKPNLAKNFCLYKNKRAEWQGAIGHICGYNLKLNLYVMALDDVNKIGIPYITVKEQGTIILTTKENSNGYIYVGVEDLIITSKK